MNRYKSRYALGRGAMVLRWQGLYHQPPPWEWPTCKVVHMDDILDEFPPDVPLVTKAEREAQLYERQLHVHERYGW